ALIAAADPASENLLLLVVSRSSSPRIESVSAATILRERDSTLLRELAMTVAGSGRPLALLGATGPDPAAVVLHFAAMLRVGRVVVLRAEDASMEDERQRATRAWLSLSVPVQSLHVELVGTGAIPSVAFELRRSVPS